LCLLSIQSILQRVTDYSASFIVSNLENQAQYRTFGPSAIMHIGKTIPFLCLSSGALSFKVRAFTGENCSGDAKEVNVWDNTCRDTNIPDTRSFRVLAYGAHRQRATFWEWNYCSNRPPEGHRSFWADGGSDNFKKDACISLDYTAQAFGSHSA
jgi:hypothetical protein